MSSKFLYFVLCLVSTAHAAALPKYLQICSRSDPELNKCVENSARNVLKNILNGDKEFNFPTFNPFYIESINFSPGSNLNITFSELYIYGLDKVIIDKIDVDWKKQHIELNYTFPELQIKANYAVDGQILLLPIRGNGPCEITFKSLASNYSFDYHTVHRKGSEYIAITKSAIKFQPGNIKYRFDNLFNGDRRLGDELNLFLNENWKEIDDEIGGASREAMTAVITSTIANFAKQFPYRHLFHP